MVVFSSCHSHHDVIPAFYYWKTIYKPTESELQKLRALHCKRMYLRLFDVDRDAVTKQIIPVAPLSARHLDTGFEYVPDIFITQKTVQTLTAAEIPALADNINSYAQELCANMSIVPPEIQMDCDWNSTTKDVYFALLKALKERPFFKGKALSCTIRLYQAKYTLRNGIPPVEKGLLMCYNMGNLKKYGNDNSILDVSDTKEYLRYIDKYPLPLDIALPLFSWCVLFRGQQYKGILREVSTESIASEHWLAKEKENLYRSTADTSWHGYHIQKGDKIRTEIVTYSDVKSIAAFTTRKVKNMSLNLVFFHCDSLILSKYTNHELETIIDCYR